MAAVQRALLNTTGPLCSLHDALSSGTQVPVEELKSIVEQTLCLLGSANHQMSVLRRKKVLANINKDKLNLAEQPLPNAKRYLFGEDFPSVARLFLVPKKEGTYRPVIDLSRLNKFVKNCHFQMENISCLKETS